MSRSPALQALVDMSAQSLRATASGAAAKRVCELFAVEGIAVDREPEVLPVCDWIAPALRLEYARTGLAAAFAAVLPQLVWRRRLTADPADTVFWNGHANAMILGPGGLEQRDDLWVGATVMAPGVVYSDHSHPPEEIYLPLAPGEWWNADMEWTDPGPLGSIYNAPGIQHRMRAGADPFLALWYLPVRSRGVRPIARFPE